jgi:hypothetical protein
VKITDGLEVITKTNNRQPGRYHDSVDLAFAERRDGPARGAQLG